MEIGQIQNNGKNLLSKFGMIDSLSMNMKFWHDGQNNSTRLENVKFCWPKLKDLANFVRTRTNIKIKESLFDFSVNQIIEDSIHISYSLGEYKISEKTNLMLKYQSEYSMFMMLDSDIFFDNTDYDSFLNLLNNIEAHDIVTFDLAKLETKECIINGIFNKQIANWAYAYAGEKKNGPLNGRFGGLGGVYIINTSDALFTGGFDENYVGWGGEDGEMLDRMVKLNGFSFIKPQRSFAPFHLPHYCDFDNPHYANRF